jgi:hypothetical protein
VLPTLTRAKKVHPGIANTVLLTVAIGALSALTGACAKLSTVHGAPHVIAGESLSLREANLQAAWIGRTYQELVLAWGTPRQILEIPGGHRPEELVVVYGVRNQAAGCVDAFTIHNGTTREPNDTSQIVNYFCR